MPLKPVAVPPSQKEKFSALLRALERVVGKNEADELLVRTNQILESVGSNDPAFAATLRFEVAAALLQTAELSEDVYQTAVEMLRKAVADRDPIESTVERALALIALGRAPTPVLEPTEAIASLREAGRLLQGLPEQLDYAVARESLAKLLADSQSPSDLKEAIEAAHDAIMVFRGSGQTWRAVDTARLMGQLALNLSDVESGQWIRLAFECQMEASSAYNQVPEGQPQDLVQRASALSDLAEVCIAGLRASDPDGLAQIRRAVSISEQGSSDPDDLQLLVPVVNQLFEFLGSQPTIATFLLAPDPELSSAVRVLMQDLVASSRELLTKEIRGTRSPRHTIGLLRRLRVTSAQ
jgi:tetratricopeptide (TPR) repeat protein